MLHPRQTKGERPIFWNRWLLVLDHARLPNRAIRHIISHHVRLGCVLLHPLSARIPPTTRQHLGLDSI